MKTLWGTVPDTSGKSGCDPEWIWSDGAGGIGGFKGYGWGHEHD